MITKLEWIKRRLPLEHGFTDLQITEELVDSGDNQYFALASLLEQLASNDKYQNETIGSYSYSNPLLMDRAKYWREYNPDPDGDGKASSISIVPLVNVDFSRPRSLDEFNPLC